MSDSRVVPPAPLSPSAAPSSPLLVVPLGKQSREKSLARLFYGSRLSSSFAKFSPALLFLGPLPRRLGYFPRGELPQPLFQGRRVGGRSSAREVPKK